MNDVKAVFVSVGGSRKRLGLVKRTGHKQKWYDGVLEASSPYKIPFRKLSMVQRTRRIDAVAKLVIATCVDRGEMRLRGKTYFERNDNLAVDVVTVLDWLRTRLQYELKVNLKTETVSTSFTPLNDADTAVREEEEERNATEIVRSEKDYSTAMSLLCESRLEP